MGTWLHLPCFYNADGKAPAAGTCIHVSFYMWQKRRSPLSPSNNALLADCCPCLLFSPTRVWCVCCSTRSEPLPLLSSVSEVATSLIHIQGTFDIQILHIPTHSCLLYKTRVLRTPQLIPSDSAFCAQRTHKHTSKDRIMLFLLVLSPPAPTPPRTLQPHTTARSHGLHQDMCGASHW